MLRVNFVFLDVYPHFPKRYETALSGILKPQNTHRNEKSAPRAYLTRGASFRWHELEEGKEDEEEREWD